MLGKFDLADKIRSQLFHMGVEVNDRAKTWSCLNEHRHPYTALEGVLTDEIDDNSQIDIELLLAERYRAKRAGDYRAADALQERLRFKGIEVDDAELKWRFNKKKVSKN